MRILNDWGPRKVEDFLGCSGSVQLMGGLMLILALIGAGYLYISYKEKKVTSDMPKILAAYEGMLDDYIKDPEDRAKLKQAFGIIADIIYKYNPTGINLKTITEIERQKMLLESSRNSGGE
ncbi:MAG: hypothetical protein ABSB95_08590 [Dissulfurispiraceae bacterium]|jgi:hypothetical protein